MMTLDRLAKLSSLAAVVLVAGACGHRQPAAAKEAHAPVTVSVGRVERVTDATTIEARGIVQPARQAMVSSRVMGPVVALHVEAGAIVPKGAKLLEIQPEAIEGQVAQAQGALAQARAALSLAERNFRRFEALHAQDAASELELDMARMSFKQAEGAVQQAEGAVQSASTVASEAVVRAPFAARVIDTLVEVGDFAAPGRPLVRVEARGERQIWLTIRETDIGHVEEGLEVPVTLDARPQLGALRGSVAEVIPAADPGTHTFTVKVDLGNIDVPSGLAGRATLAGDTGERLLIPGSAIHRRGGLELVVVCGSQGSAETRAITTGTLVDDGRVEVLSGLDEGLEVVLDAPGPLPDGTPLEVRR
jgi:RND family efflux transporter MFP subunit